MPVLHMCACQAQNQTLFPFPVPGPGLGVRLYMSLVGGCSVCYVFQVTARWSYAVLLQSGSCIGPLCENHACIGTV